MIINQTFKTIRLIDLIDTTNSDMTSLYSQMSNNLISLFENKVYPVNDNALWANFIERLCDRYFNRYLSFDTYYAWQIKLKFVLEQNREKYLKIYENSLREIDPLITYSETEHTDEKRKSEGTNDTTSHNEYDNNSETKTTYGKTDKTADTREITVKNETDDNRTITGFSSNPKSQSSLSAHMTDLQYIDNEQLQIVKNDFTNTTKNGGELNSIAGGSDTNRNDSDGKSDSTSNSTYKGNDSNILDRLRKGFNGNQLELLKKYEEIYFDVNKEIIEDIDRARLFMSVLC